MKEFLSKSPEETRDIAFDFAKKLNLGVELPSRATVVGLYGDLGSGKTTFMKYFAEALEVEETIQSPTFVIMKIFELKGSKYKKLIHIDAYRLDSGEELNKLGWQELLADSGNLICIEWPERVAEVMPEHLMLRFEHYEGKEGGETTRKISFA